jgi:hypothetical protein
VALTGRAGLLVALLVAGCGSAQEPPPASVEGESRVELGAPCAPRPVLVADPAPSVPVELPPAGVLTDVTEQAGQRLVTGRVEATVEQVLAHFRAAPGYVVTRDEAEGRAGELLLFGARGDVAVTVATLTCPRGFTGFTIATAAGSGSTASPPG